MLKREHFEYKETAVTIITDDSLTDLAKNAVFEARGIIEMKILQDPFFGTTYEPYPAYDNDHELIRRMCIASEKTGVGPMASVAGAVSVYAVEQLERNGASYAVVENGGDIAVLADRPVVIGLYSGDPELNDISLKLEPTGVTGVCSSSGRVGPSVSFGSSDICTVFSDDVILADAAATQLGNLISDNDDIGNALETVGSIDGIEGCIAYKDGLMAMFGSIPELIRSEMRDDRITKILYDV